MSDQTRWLDQVLQANIRFQRRIRSETLPVMQSPGSVAVITCKDQRINLEAIGIPQFGASGENDSQVRVIRTAGAMLESRSFVIGTFLAGIREFIFLTHTDCGCSLAYSKIDVIIENLSARLSPSKLIQFKNELGEPFRQNLITWLKAFQDPREALRKEIRNLKGLSYIPDDVVFHGLLYEVESGKVEVVVNGYDSDAA